jgi:hypothetical protein
LIAALEALKQAPRDPVLLAGVETRLQPPGYSPGHGADLCALCGCPVAERSVRSRLGA